MFECWQSHQCHYIAKLPSNLAECLPGQGANLSNSADQPSLLFPNGLYLCTILQDARGPLLDWLHPCFARELKAYGLSGCKNQLLGRANSCRARQFADAAKLVSFLHAGKCNVCQMLCTTTKQ